MKKLIFILCVILFSCTKQESAPIKAKQKINIQIGIVLNDSTIVYSEIK